MAFSFSDSARDKNRRTRGLTLILPCWHLQDDLESFPSCTRKSADHTRKGQPCDESAPVSTSDELLHILSTVLECLPLEDFGNR